MKILRLIVAWIFGLSVLLALFLYEVTLSSFKVLWWIYTKRSKIESEIFEIHMQSRKTWQRILIAHFITLTPGTLSIEFTEKGGLLIHCLEKSAWNGTEDLVRKKLEPLLKRMEYGA